MLSDAAPEHRPPQPIMPILTVSLPAAWALRLIARLPRAAVVAEAFRNSRREDRLVLVELLGSVMIAPLL
jgi:hypothetical protein